MEKQKQQPQRLQSLDALRGFDMLFIMGGASLFVALATLFPNPFFQAIAGQMEHVEWNGLAHHDTIFGGLPWFSWDWYITGYCRSNLTTCVVRACWRVSGWDGCSQPCCLSVSVGKCVRG